MPLANTEEKKGLGRPDTSRTRRWLNITKKNVTKEHSAHKADWLKVWIFEECSYEWPLFICHSEDMVFATVCYQVIKYLACKYLNNCHSNLVTKHSLKIQPVFIGVIPRGLVTLSEIHFFNSPKVCEEFSNFFFINQMCRW